MYQLMKLFYLKRQREDTTVKYYLQDFNNTKRGPRRMWSHAQNQPRTDLINAFLKGNNTYLRMWVETHKLLLGWETEKKPHYTTVPNNGISYTSIDAENLENVGNHEEDNILVNKGKSEVDVLQGGNGKMIECYNCDCNYYSNICTEDKKRRERNNSNTLL
eukprot:10147236-Ditylum_brightwellii.AAC.1